MSRKKSPAASPQNNLFPKIETSSLAETLDSTLLISDYKEDQFLQNIYFSLYKKIGSFAKLTHRKERNKVAEYLAEKGFKALARLGTGHLEGTYFSSEAGATPYYLLEKDGMIVGVGANLDFLYEYTEENTKFIENCADFLKEKLPKESQISLLISEYGDLALKDFEMKPMKMDLDFYNEEFKEDYDFISKFLKSDETGIILLMGEPGTGKSSLIKTFLNSIKTRKLVYIPFEMIGQIGTPAFLGFAMSEFKDVTLIIEDGDSLLLSHHGERQPGTTQILNLGDGILGELLNIQIILTANIPDTAENIDEAVMRPGRLKKMVRFEKLTIDRAQKVADKLKLNTTVTKPMTIAELFSHGKDNGNKKKEKRSMNLFAN